MAEFTATLLFAICGAMVIAGASDLLILFLGLELLVLPGYMLAGYAKRDGLLHRGRHQVLPAGLLQLGHLPLRPGLHLGLHGHDHGSPTPQTCGSAGSAQHLRRAWPWASPC